MAACRFHLRSSGTSLRRPCRVRLACFQMLKALGTFSLIILTENGRSVRSHLDVSMIDDRHSALLEWVMESDDIKAWAITDVAKLLRPS